MKHQRQQYFKLALTTLFILSGIIVNQSAFAQLKPDHTLGSENSVVNKVNEFKDIINGGAARGANLFHSFEKFHVGENRSVYFANPTGIENILTRVTGGNVSNILGTLGVEGTANLFLINPNGIFFGQNAVLDIRGSFTATTADSIKLGENGLFSATAPATSNLLTVQPGALFTNALRNQQAEIRSEGNLTVGQNLTFNAIANITTSNITAYKIILNSINGEINTTRGILDTSSDTGQAGDITLQAATDIKVGKITSTSQNSSGGNIKLISGNSISIEGFVQSGTNLCNQANFCNKNSATGGDIYIKSPLIKANNNGVLVNIEGLGKGGNLIIDTDIFNLSGTYNANFGTGTDGSGHGGNLIVKAKEIYLIDGGTLESSTNGLGNAGNIYLTTNKLLIKDNRENPLFQTGITSISQVDIPYILKSRLTNFQLTNNDFQLGKGGDIIIDASESVEIIGNRSIADSLETLETLKLFLNISAGIGTGTSTMGQAGKLIINTKKLTTQNGAGISTSSIAPKFLPNIYPNIPSEVNNQFNQLDDIKKSEFISQGITPTSIINNVYNELSKFSNAGNSGNLEVNADQIKLIGAGGLSTATTTSSYAGNLLINSKQISLQDGSIITATTLGNSDAGSVNITTNQLSISNGSKVLTGTSNKGFGGNINITASDLVEAIGTSYDGKSSSGILVLSDNNSTGNAGNITLNTPNLTIRDGARIEAQTKGTGTAGNILINNANLIDISGMNTFGINSGLLSSSENPNSGNGGTIIINQGNPQGILHLSDGGFLSVLTRSSNKGGEIGINVNSLNIENGGKIISTATVGSHGNAGNINLTISDNITLDGTNTGLFANTEIGSTGDSGNIIIDPELLIIKNGAGIGVNSEGTGKGGDVSVQSGTLSLDNKAFISAETGSNQGGNINLVINDLLLFRNNSQITATAGKDDGSGNGGNITINTPFIIAFPSENSDITANAFQGNGGKIDIITNAIFGLKYRPQLTPESDITASSQFGLAGKVEINTPDVDPTSGLIELHGNLVDAESLLGKDICSYEQRAKNNSFTITGKGGLPAESGELISNSPGMVEWVIRSDKQETTPVVMKEKAVNQEEANIKNPVIQEAQGWIITADGKVILTAETPKITLQNSGLNHPSCH